MTYDIDSYSNMVHISWVADLAASISRCECKSSQFDALFVAESKLYVFCGKLAGSAKGHTTFVEGIHPSRHIPVLERK